MYSNFTRFNYQTHTHITITSTSHTQLSHNFNVTQCKICDAMHVVPNCEPEVSPLSDSISRIQATLPIRTRPKPTKCKHIVYRLRFTLESKPRFCFKANHLCFKAHHDMNVCTMLTNIRN